MLAEMSARLFYEWCEYLRQEPWGDEVTNRQIAELCAIAASVGGAKGVKSADFLPTIVPNEPPKPKSNEELHSLFTQFAGLHNAKEEA